MKKYLLLAIPFLAGCFKDEPKLPQYYAKQEIDVATDSIICFSGHEDFDHFNLICSQPFDSLHWFANYSYALFLGSGQPLELPNAPYGYEAIKCLGFINGDTTELYVRLAYCARYMYIPVAFSPDYNGINDSWFPVYYTTNDGINFQPYTIHWEIRTLDGIKIFETDDREGKWDGTYNDHPMPTGSYLYYIELKIEGEDPVEYTGWIELLG